MILLQLLLSLERAATDLCLVFPRIARRLDVYFDVMMLSALNLERNL